MAEFKATITTPEPPAKLRVSMPGQAKGSLVPLSEFTENQLSAITKEYGEKLQAARADQIKAKAAGVPGSGNVAGGDAGKSDGDGDEKDERKR